MTTEEKFWSKVDKNGPVCIHHTLGDIGHCWLWTAGRSSGYAQMRAVGSDKPIRMHRYSWELANNQTVPGGLDVCHHCDVPHCVRPSHLFVDTRLANIRDALNKGRLAPQRETFKRLWKNEWAGVRCGENIHCGKLTKEQVLEIRSLYAKNDPLARKGKEYPLKRLASMFLVSESSIYEIVTRQNWKHI